MLKLLYVLYYIWESVVQSVGAFVSVFSVYLAILLFGFEDMMWSQIV